VNTSSGRAPRFTAALPWLAIAALTVATSSPSANAQTADAVAPRLGFVGLHGGIFDVLKSQAPALGLDVEFIRDAQISDGTADFSRYAVVFLQHVRDDDRETYVSLLAASKACNRSQRIISISGVENGILADLARRELVEYDPQLQAYYGTSRENLRRLLLYVAGTYLHRPGEIPPPVEGDAPRGLYHPDAGGVMLPNTAAFLDWAKAHGRDVENRPRVVIAVHDTHLAFQQPEIANALVREFEKQGALAVAMVDMGPQYLAELKAFQPLLVVHTCHSSETVDNRLELDIPHLSSIFFREQSIDEWRPGITGLAASEAAFQVVGQELLGAIEPQIGAGTQFGGGSEEAFIPISERIEHLVRRSMGWLRLAQLKNANKRVAFVYYDRELGKSELMRGSATGMFMNGPRSLVGVLEHMKAAGYGLTSVPAGEQELLDLMSDHGRQIGVWAPGELDRLARSGLAVLVPVEKYLEWFETKVPEPQRKELISKWGPAPGKFLTWSDGKQQFIVIPRIDLGNVILVPQPLRGEAHDTSLLHDVRVPPPHNYLATYFWLEEQFKANALVHFGTHGSEFALPGKPTGLSNFDWSDIVLGGMPNINPWIINNLGESPPARRRAYAVLIDHLTPPTVNAELSDGLLNLHNDIDRWVVLEPGALKGKFAQSITEQVYAEHLERDVRLDTSRGTTLSGEDIDRVLAYLHDIHNETTPISLHVFGEPPRGDLLIPYLVTCLRKPFLDALGEVLPVPAGEALNEGDRRKFLRRKAEEIVELLVRRDHTPQEALAVVAGLPADAPLPEEVEDGCKLALRLADGFAKTPQETENLMRALDGQFIPPGPGGGPDRNPAVVPTGRNMNVINPEEVPSRPSWELGVQLIDQLLAERLKSKGSYPERVGFTLNAFATFQDYGVMESQILYLMGVRPVWDEQNLVVDVEVIPAAELSRPRIDVFIASFSYYRDLLPTRMRLIDKATRLIAQLDEPENRVFLHSQEIAGELEQRGIAAESVSRLASARIFGYPPGQMGSASYYYLVERSGQWEGQDELMRAYLEHVRYVYTDGMWGEAAPEAYDRQIQGTEIVLRSWSDRTTSPLSNKYTWFHGGSLAAAVKHLTGQQPDFILTDVRDADDARMISAEEALRKDFRVRLFNRKWIEGMMREGYAGADQISVHVTNTMGWKIMRPDSVTDDQWQEIVNIYLRDSKQLSVREWFEAENPFALQEMHEVLLETIRMGYWKPDSATVREIAEGYARSVARHGTSGGLRSGGNTKLDTFVRQTLESAPGGDTANLVAAYQAKLAEAAEAASAELATASSQDSAGENAAAAPNEAPASASTKPVEAPPPQREAQPEQVAGRQLVPTQPSDPAAVSSELPQVDTTSRWIAGLTAVAVVLVVAGFARRRSDLW
jgi:cobaltochelatase CobN